MEKRYTPLSDEQRGFTFIEVLVAMVIGMILLAAIVTATMQGYQSSSGISQQVAIQEELRAAMDIMAGEIAMASYSNSTQFKNWISPTGPTDCATPCDVTTCTYRGIQLAAASAITVEENINNSANLMDSPNGIIRYVYLPGERRITRSTNCGGAMPFIGGPPSDSLRARNVEIINNILGIPMFEYYNGSGVEIPAASLPGAIPTIQRIRITIAAQALVPDYQGQLRRMVLTTSVTPRNHPVIPE